MKYDNIKEATQAWVREFNAIPWGIAELILNTKGLPEVTPPAVGRGVCILDGEYAGEYGEIVKTCYDGDEESFIVQPDGSDDTVLVTRDEIDPVYEDTLPMWGTMWAFGDGIDNDWLSGEFGENGLQLMADCGFRIYEQEDYGYIFGIDGAGYDFYEAHWIPLYKARGMHWHKSEEDA